MAVIQSNEPVNGFRVLDIPRAALAVWEPAWQAISRGYTAASQLQNATFEQQLNTLATTAWSTWVGGMRDLRGRLAADLGTLLREGVPGRVRAGAAARLGMAALGAYAPLATAYRLMRGGGLWRDEYGRPDIAFLPFF